MRPLSNPEILDLWESGLGCHPLDQGLLALARAFPELSYDSLADWPLGRRNRALAELRCACFGSALQGWMACTQCGEKLEFEMDCRALTDQENDTAPSIVANGRSFRLPTSRDLARVAAESDSRRASILLLEGCRTESGEAEEWTDEDLDTVGEKLALADPSAETLLTLQCPSCSYEWTEALDIAAFLWAEIDTRAKRLLFDIHTLASSYGWTEREILSLSSPRRAFYMEMVQR